MAFPTGGGWVYFQPQTSWRNPAAMIGKDASIDAIRKHRLANPAIAAKHKLSTDPVVIERELIEFQQARGALPPDQRAPDFFARSRSSLPARVAAVAGKIRRAAQGSAVWLEWLSKGGIPEPRPLAEARALTCVNCSKNVTGDWFTVAPAQLLKAAIEDWKRITGKDFEFKTEQGDKLKSCDVCLCLSQIKVFLPLSIIVEKTKPEVMKEFPPNCWIAKRDA